MKEVMSPILEAKGIEKTYPRGGGRIEVLKGIYLKIDPGELWVIEGASGSGKSTLLHILGGLEIPTRGSVYFKGEDLFQKSEEDLAFFRNRHLGFVFQFHHLLPLFTALENVMMPCLIAGISKKEARERATLILQKVGLEQRGPHLPGELSGGEQQRVAIARALVMNPQILMADEPTGNLDSKTSQIVFAQLLKLHQSLNTTLVVVTHNEEMASHFPKRIHIQDGKLLES